jgi:hypothetical protein
MKAGERVMQIGVGGGMKAGVAVWRALKTFRDNHPAWAHLGGRRQTEADLPRPITVQYQSAYNERAAVDAQDALRKPRAEGEKISFEPAREPRNLKLRSWKDVSRTDLNEWWQKPPGQPVEEDGGDDGQAHAAVEAAAAEAAAAEAAAAEAAAEAQMAATEAAATAAAAAAAAAAVNADAAAHSSAADAAATEEAEAADAKADAAAAAAAKAAIEAAEAPDAAHSVVAHVAVAKRPVRIEADSSDSAGGDDADGGKATPDAAGRRTIKVMVVAE